jgi:dihydroorotate dehydrogenase electron transfer subunit
VRRVRAEVLNAKRIGAYHSITIVAPEVAERVRPGQFVSVAMPAGRTFLLRRHFSIHQAYKGRAGSRRSRRTSSST